MTLVVQGSLEETIVAMGCRRRRRAPLGRAADGQDDASRFTVRDAVTDAVRAPPCPPLACPALPAAGSQRDAGQGLGLAQAEVPTRLCHLGSTDLSCSMRTVGLGATGALCCLIVTKGLLQVLAVRCAN